MRPTTPVLAFLVLAPLSFAADVVTAVHGAGSRVDSAAKTVAVKTADGTVHTMHMVRKTTVHGTEAGAKDSFDGFKEGSEVVAPRHREGCRGSRSRR